VSWRRFLRRRFWDDERARELESYLQIETDENIARGLSPDEARAAAHRRLGNATLAREEIYRMNTVLWLETLWQDVRHGLRLLRINPTFTAVALLSLTLGIGANSAIFQLLNAVRIRTLPVDHPEELALVHLAPGANGRTGDFRSRLPALTNPQWERIRDEQEAFSSIFAWGTGHFDLATSGASRPVNALFVSGGIFDTLRIKPVAGRLFTASDDQRGCAPAGAVISYGFWQHEYAGDPGVIGRPLSLDRVNFEVLGVTPAGFHGVEVGYDFDVAVPICVEPHIRGADSVLDVKYGWWLAVIGRLKPGWTVGRATAQLAAISPGIFASTAPEQFGPEIAASYKAMKLEAVPAATGVSNLRTSYVTPLWLLLSIAGLVLLIACANLANLLLARAAAREQEIAVRLAIGAARVRIVRQLMAESLLLAVAGGVLGIGVAQLLSRLLVSALATTSSSLVLDLQPDWRVIGFTAALAVLTCLLFGLAPAVRATRTQPASVMRAGGRGLTDGRERFGLRRALVVLQVAVSLVLVVAALLFAGTLRNLRDVNPGERVDGILVVDIAPVEGAVAPEAGPQLEQRIADRLAHIPGVQAASTVNVVPLSGDFWNNGVVVDGVRQDGHTNVNEVMPAYFETMGIPLVAGRTFQPSDTPGTPKVAVVSAAFARKYFPGVNAVGRSFHFTAGPGEHPAYEIVGIVGDSKYGGLRETPGPIVYQAVSQETERTGEIAVLLHSDLPIARLRSSIVSAVAAESPGAILQVSALADEVRDSLVRERLMATLSVAFAVLALMLAAAGLYGVLSYSIARRRGEIGIRMALGADRRRIVAMVMGEMTMLVGVGVVAGLALSALASRTAGNLLFGLQPGDPGTLAFACGVLLLIAVVAGLMPARRASRLDPANAIRERS
jgi:putative ABC transport system permease protein